MTLVIMISLYIYITIIGK